MNFKKLSAAFLAIVQSSAMVFGLVGGSLAVNTVVSSPVVADSLQDGLNSAKPTGASDNLFGQAGIFRKIADTLIFIVGAVAVIMLIIGGLRYVLSAGDSKNVSAAKDTILYAVIGIVVALLSFALLQFVVNQVKGGSSTGSVHISSHLG